MKILTIFGARSQFIKAGSVSREIANHTEIQEVIVPTGQHYDDNTVYYLMGGVDPDKRNLGGTDMVQFESIKFALESTRAFDFEGSMIQSIEKYFRSFGAIQKPYFKISKENSKILKIRQLIKEIIR